MDGSLMDEKRIREIVREEMARELLRLDQVRARAAQGLPPTPTELLPTAKIDYTRKSADTTN